MKLDRVTGEFCIVSTGEKELKDLYSLVEFSIRELDFDHIFTVDDRKELFDKAQEVIEHLVSEVKHFNGRNFQFRKDDIRPVSKLLNQIGLEHKKPKAVAWEDYDKTMNEIGIIRDTLFPI